jgi:predicted GNAT family N-acyltransferase
MTIKSPQQPAEWASYFQLRWEILRAPWGQAIGSEKDELDNDQHSFHAMALNTNNDIVGVARLHLLADSTAQLRFMAVNKISQGSGVGSLIINYLEDIAKAKHSKRIILQARENAVLFYEKHGYKIKEKSFLMYNQIQHYLMEKDL